MNNRSSFLIAVLSVTLFSGAAFAHSQDPAATPGIDRRQELQQKRIDQGVQSGQLNQKETARLERRQAHIRKMEDRAKADGTVTRKERARIHHAQDHASRQIHREKHDRQRAR